MKVRVTNFQSIKDVEVEVDGFTVITGPNNSGKTALIRALRGAFQNTAGTAFVRHGEDSCRVEVSLDEETSFAWEKGHKIKPSYDVGGKTLNPGRDIPDEVTALGVRPVQAGGREIWPQIANQFSGQVFLVDQPGSVLAEAVADVERVGKLNRALKAAEKDKRAASSELKVRRKDLKALEVELQTFDGIDTVEGLVAACEASEAKVLKIERAVTGLNGLKDRLEGARQVVASLSPVRSAFECMDDSEGVLHGCKETHAEINDLTSLRDRISAAQADRDAAQAAFESAGATTLPTTAKLEKLVRGIEAFRSLSNKRAIAEAQVEEVRDALKSAESQLADLTKEIGDTLGELGECPVCGTGTHTTDCSGPIAVAEVGGVQ